MSSVGFMAGPQGTLYPIDARNATYATDGRKPCGPSAWHISGTSHPVQCVQYVQETAQNGRSGRPWAHLLAVSEVEGLVEIVLRSGSSPLGHIEKPCKSGLF